MNLFQRIKSALVRRKRPQITDPTRSDFDVDAWLDESIRRREQNPDKLFVCFPTDEGLAQGLSDNGGARPPTDADRRAS